MTGILDKDFQPQQCYQQQYLQPQTLQERGGCSKSFFNLPPQVFLTCSPASMEEQAMTKQPTIDYDDDDENDDDDDENDHDDDGKDWNQRPLIGGLCFIQPVWTEFSKK